MCRLVEKEQNTKQNKTHEMTTENKRKRKEYNENLFEKICALNQNIKNI